MTTAPPSLQAARAPAPAAAYRATPTQNLVTIALAWWLLGGLFLDGWDSFD